MWSPANTSAVGLAERKGGCRRHLLTARAVLRECILALVNPEGLRAATRGEFPDGRPWT